MPGDPASSFWSHVKLSLRLAKYVIEFSAATTTVVLALASSALVGVVISSIQRNLGWVLPLVGFLLGGLAVAAAFLLLQVRSVRKLWFIRGYRVRSEKHTLVKLDSTTYESVDEYEILALRPGVEVFECKYEWTGSADGGPPVIKSAGHEWLGSRVSGPWKLYYVFLGQGLGPGERTTLVVSQTFRDPQLMFRPYLSVVAANLIAQVELVVELPQHETIATAKLVHSSGLRRIGLTLESAEPEIDRTRNRVRAFVRYPRLGDEYALHWTCEKPSELRTH